MDVYFVAAGDADALEVRDLAGGPMPGSGYDAVEAKDVLACPHLEQLVEIASGISRPSLVPQLKTLWPEPSPTADGSDFVPGPMICRLPDLLRDDLARVTVDGVIAERWAAELWGFEPAHAGQVAKQLTGLARRAIAAGRSVYWYSEL